MPEHHRQWLAAHPTRSEAWLLVMLKDGFDVHHLDGNHANNDPANLVLIEHSDHMMLHGSRMLGRLAPYRRGGRTPKDHSLSATGARAYHMRISGLRWVDCGGRSALVAARNYAKALGLAWPPIASVLPIGG